MFSVLDMLSYGHFWNKVNILKNTRTIHPNFILYHMELERGENKRNKKM